MVETAAGVDAPSRECVYRVRVLQAWAPESPVSETKSAPDTSFFGLQLELHGVQADSDPPAAASLTLAFDHSAQRHDALTVSSAFASLVGPFAIRVTGKQPATTASERTKRVRQTFAAVQPGNALFKINGVCFLAPCRTAHDVYRQLVRVVTRVSLATPFELTFSRHNHAQAAAKVVPFAMRIDVQRAQVAQHTKMQAHDAALSDAVCRKKLCITQQIDYEQEQYLLSHIGHDLVALHDATMASGQWQACEFDQALWYFHAPATRLYAEHPMRSSDATRQLLGAVQFQTRFAAQRLQRAVRISLRRNALASAGVSHDKLLETIWQDVWAHAWTRIWLSESRAREPGAPLEVAPEPAAATPEAAVSTESLGVDQETARLVQRWRERSTTTSTGSPALTLADVVKHGIPSRRAQERASATASATDAVHDDATLRSLHESPAPSPPLSSVLTAPPASLARPLPIVQVDESTQTPTPRALSSERDEKEVEVVDERPAGPTGTALVPTDSSAPALTKEALVDAKKKKAEETEATTDNEEGGDDDDRREWCASLTLLKASLQHKKALSPPKHSTQSSSLGPSPTQRTRVDGVGAERAGGRSSDRDERDSSSSALPRVARSDGARLSTTSTIAPAGQSPMVPFMLKKPSHALASDSYKLHGNGDDDDDRELPAPTSLLLRQPPGESFGDSADAWPHSASFRAFHSFFAQSVDDDDTALPSTSDVPSMPWPQSSIALVRQQQHRYDQPLVHSSTSGPMASPQRLLPSALLAPAPFASTGDYDVDSPLPSTAASSLYRQQQQQQPSRKALTATELAILRHDRAMYAAHAGAWSPTKLPYIVRKKRPSPS